MKTESLLTDFNLHLLAEGTLHRGYRVLGAHLQREEGRDGVRFAVWAPNASKVSVVGDFNDWDAGRQPMTTFDASGVWETFVPGIGEGALYKYRIESRDGRYRADKADPYGFSAQLRPATASRVVSLEGYEWGDAAWLADRAGADLLRRPMSIYEVHLGSWRRKPEEQDRWLTYAELATELRGLRPRDGLHARRVPAALGAPVRRLLGLSDRRVLTPRPAGSGRPRI